MVMILRIASLVAIFTSLSLFFCVASFSFSSISFFEGGCGFEDDNKYELYCLNNIEDIEIQQHTFKIVKDFDPRSFFDDYYGVVIDDELPTERIVLRAYRDERFELRDVPLHHSQHFLQWNNDEDFADLELRLKPTLDFMDFLISKCVCLKVLSPQSLIDQLRERMERGLNMYKINQ